MKHIWLNIITFVRMFFFKRTPMSGYYKTSKGKVVGLEQENVLHLSFNNIIELIIPDSCKKVYCGCNQLTELIIPDGCKEVYCGDNQLKKLIIPDGCKVVSCFDNELKELIIPDGCEWVSCENNQLKELMLPDGCEKVWADLKSVTILNKVDDLSLQI